MANHGYVYTKQRITQKQLLKNIQEINDEIFGGLMIIDVRIEYFVENAIHIYSDYFNNKGVELWISNEEENAYEDENGNWIEYDNPKIISHNSVIEFRHGHIHSIRWWLEGVFRENLAKKYNALVGDDGHDKRSVAEPEKYIWEEFAKNDFFWKSMKNEYFFNKIKTDEEVMNDFFKEINHLKRTKKLTKILKNKVEI